MFDPGVRVRGVAMEVQTPFRLYVRTLRFVMQRRCVVSFRVFVTQRRCVVVLFRRGAERRLSFCRDATEVRRRVVPSRCGTPFRFFVTRQVRRFVVGLRQQRCLKNGPQLS